MERDTIQEDWFDALTIEGYLGCGSFGFVFTTKGKLIENVSAVKITFPDYPPNPEEKATERKHVLREYANMVGKYHENVVNIFAFTEKQFTHNNIEEIAATANIDELETTVHDRIAVYSSRARRLGSIEGICIQMELCGPTLRQWINKYSAADKMNPNDDLHHRFQVETVLQLVEGVKFLHKNKIIHRDLKPENILFSATSDLNHDFSLPIKIGDFGLCRQVHANETPSSSLTSRQGTEDYRAPEVNSKDYSLQADLFSLGLIIWEVLQLIKSNERKSLFDRLVYGKKTYLVLKHPNIANSKNVIVLLTQFMVDQRYKSASDVQLQIIGIARKCKLVTTSEQFQTCLDMASDGDVIELSEGIFVGKFILKRKKLFIKGQGELTIVSSNSFFGAEAVSDLTSGTIFKIVGSNCQISNVKLLGPGLTQNCLGIWVESMCNTISDIYFEDCMRSLLVAQNQNTFSNLHISNSGSTLRKVSFVIENGITVQGNDNRFQNIHVQNSPNWGVRVSGENNHINSITCQNAKYGLEVKGSDNKIEDINIHVNIRSGYGNIVNNLRYNGPFSGLILGSQTRKAVITGANCRQVAIYGTEHQLINVVARECIDVHGYGHLFQSCKTPKCKYDWMFLHDDNSIIDCNF